MNRIKIYYLLFFLFLFLIHCKKEDGHPAANSTNPTIVIDKTQSIIQPSANLLRLHVTNTASLSGTLYYADGTMPTSQPSFTWQVDDSSVLSVKHGNITPKGLGTAQIAITDGVHGTSFAHVSVVADSVVIPSAPASIIFNPYMMHMVIGSGNQKTIPSYIIRDFKGNPVSATPTFEIQEANSGILISGNTISATKKGVFHLLAKYNGAYLAGALIVGVYPNVQKDTTIVSLGTSDIFPIRFNKYNFTTLPINLHVFESGWKNNSLFFKWYDAPPDNIIVDYPNVVRANSNGSLTSISPGITSMKLTLKNASLSAVAFVMVDLTGNWGGTGPDGTNYNFCFDSPYPFYFGAGAGLYQDDINGEYLYQYQYTNGLYYVDRSNSAPLTGKCVIYPGGYLNQKGPLPAPGAGDVSSQIGQLFCNDITLATVYSPDGYAGYYIQWMADNNKLKMLINNGTSFVTLTNGNGNCAPPQSCSVSTYTITDQSGSKETTTYTYDSNNRLISVSDPSNSDNSFTIAYNPQGTPTKVTSYITYTLAYDANNRLASLNNGSYTITYTYNSSGQVTKIVYGGDGSYEQYQYSSTTNNNYSTITSYDSKGKLVSTTTYQYDNKKNWYTNTTILGSIGERGSPIATTNNVISTSQAGGVSSTDTFTYTYNNEGFPMTANETYTDGTGASTYTFSFVYTNCKN